MTDRTRRAVARLGAVAGSAMGLVLLIRPQQVLDPVAPAFPRERRWVVRALGARMVAQHGAVLARPEPAVLTSAAGVDLLHAASMLPFLASARYGRAARTSAAVALGSGLAHLALAFRRPPVQRLPGGARGGPHALPARTRP